MEVLSRNPDRTALPPVGEAEPGSVLNELDHWHADREAALEEQSAERWATAGARALAVFRGEPDPFPDEPVIEDSGEPTLADDVDDDEIDMHTPSGICLAKNRGLLPGRFYQSDADYRRHIAAYRTRSFEKLTGRRVASKTISSVRSRSRGRAERRPGQRRVAAPTRDGPDDPGGDGEPPRTQDGPRHIGVVLADWLPRFEAVRIGTATWAPSAAAGSRKAAREKDCGQDGGVA